jgi:uncharacterized protein with GYD domain
MSAVDPSVVVERREHMPYYLVQAAYTSDAWATMVKSPQNRMEAVRPVVERAGGTVECAYLAFGEYDIVAIFQLPDNVAAASIAMAIAAGGAVKAIKTTPLMSLDEAREAMSRAGGAGYQPPR